jgi:glycosyltransferase involved in cell wall biosynthesis
MTKNKLKVLMCSEASFLTSGFGTYAKEILSRLHKTNKFHIAEFASYAVVNDIRDKDISWRFYANAVRENDPRYQEYISRQDNQFGRWRFEKVLLDFRPDVVIDVRDYWMSYYQSMSPLRKYFHWILMPTVDSAPQQEEWIDTYLEANAIFTYSDWGADVIKKQSFNKINHISTASPGVDLSVFKILENKADIKSSLGIAKDSIIIGSVMRNQKRKLFPELLFSFRKLLDRLQIEDSEKAKKIYLYFHTSYPDAGWDIPELLKQTRLSNRVLFTYFCGRCNHIEASTYCHPSKICRNCIENTCRLPSVAIGVPNNILSKIYNTFDLYVQYAICEGFGMPQVEAAACGVQVATVNYSAMIDIINKLDAYKIDVGCEFKELETKAIRVYPNNDSLIQHIINHINLPDPIRQQQRYKIRELTQKHYCWDAIAKKWESYFDKLTESGYVSRWSDPPRFLNNIPENQNIDMTNIAKICADHLSDYSKLSSMFMLNMCKDSKYEFTQSGTHYQHYGQRNVIETLQAMINNHNQAEHARVNNIKFNEDFIDYAHMKDVNR